MLIVQISMETDMQIHLEIAVVRQADAINQLALMPLTPANAGRLKAEVARLAALLDQRLGDPVVVPIR